MCPDSATPRVGLADHRCTRAEDVDVKRGEHLLGYLRALSQWIVAEHAIASAHRSCGENAPSLRLR